MSLLCRAALEVNARLAARTWADGRKHILQKRYGFEFSHALLEFVLGRTLSAPRQFAWACIGAEPADRPTRRERVVLTIPTGQAPLRLQRMQDFVRLLGSGYFFLPGRKVVRFLGK